MYINWEPTLHFHPNNLQPTDNGIPLPTYGNYGGTNYSAGVIGGTTPETPDPAPVDQLDALFYQHDLVYQHYQDGTATTADLRAADLHLITGIAALTYTDNPRDPSYDPEAGIYAGFATLAIAGQLAASGSLYALSPADQQAVASAVQEGVTNLESGLAAAPNEGRSLHGAFHVFEAKYLDLLL